ncbi:MAG: hypothetical protein GY861_29185, partial [bacterium]|nr:hypothetical protein [bacterium]
MFGKEFTLISDHAPLKWLMSASHSSGRLQRWALTLQEYNFQIKHKAGRLNANADALSRLGLIATFSSTSMMQAQYEDPQLSPIIEALKRCDTLAGSQSAYFLQDNILFRKSSLTSRESQEFSDQLVVPDKRKQDILEEAHDSVFGGHHGFKKTLDKLHLRYFWPRMYKQVKWYCTTCELCKRKKGPHRRNRAPLVPIPVSGA